MEEQTFEDAIENLEKIVSELENEKLTLDESVKKFEEGMRLSKYCNEILEKAQKQISILIADDNGDLKEETFITEE